MPNSMVRSEANAILLDVNVHYNFHDILGTKLHFYWQYSLA